MARPGRSEIVAISVIMAAATLLRVAWLGDVPRPMNQDEVLRGYDAWCLWDTHGDYHGTRWPLFLQAYGPGEYVSAISSYLTAPLVGLFGPDVLVVRLPFALAGIATVLVVWLWVRAEFCAWAGCAAAALLAISPWHIHISRVAFEGDLTPSLVTLGVWLGLGRISQLKPDAAHCVRVDWRETLIRVVGGVSLGLAMWTYPAPRLVVPLLLVAWLWWLRRAAAGLSRQFAMPVLVGVVIGAWPLWWTAVTQPEIVLARAANVGLFGAGSVSDGVIVFARQYAAHFNPYDLYMAGQRSTHQYPPDEPLVGVVEFALALVGLAWLLARHRATLTGKLLIAWLLLYPIPASLTRGGMPGMVRSIMGLPLVAVLAGVAVSELIGWMSLRAPSGRKSIGVVLCLCWSLACGWMAWRYLHGYAAQDPTPHNTRLAQVFRQLRAIRQPNDSVIVAFRTNQGFAYHLFFERVPPRTALSGIVERRPWTGGFEQVLRWGDTYFCPADLGREMTAAEVSLWSRQVSPVGRKLVVKLPSQWDGSPADRTLQSQAGPAGFEIVMIEN